MIAILIQKISDIENKYEELRGRAKEDWWRCVKMASQ